jgi:hypothetical protein
MAGIVADPNAFERDFKLPFSDLAKSIEVSLLYSRFKKNSPRCCFVFERLVPAVRSSAQKNHKGWLGSRAGHRSHTELGNEFQLVLFSFS